MSEMVQQHAGRWRDETAERWAIGAAFIAGSVEDAAGRCSCPALKAMAAIARPDDFANPRHATIWEALLAVDARGEPVDYATVSSELAARRRLNTVGGRQYLGEIVDETSSAAHCTAHARIVAGAARVRRKREALAAALALIDESGDALDALLARVDRHVRDAAAARPEAGTSARDHAIAACEMMLAAVESRALGRRSVARFGIPCLDGADDGSHEGLLGGILPTRVVTVSGPPAEGKTTLATQAAVTTAEDGGRVLWFSTEIPGPEVSIRYACQRSFSEPDQWGRVGEPISQVAALRGLLSQPTNDNPRARDEVSEMVKWFNRFAELPITIRSEGLSIESIAAEVSAACAAGDVRLVVVDYFQDLDPSGKPSETEEQKHRARVLKAIARENRVGVLAVSSTTKSSQRDRAAGKRATAADVNGAGIAWASDVILEVARVGDDDGATATVRLTVTKARYGQRGAPTLRFDLRRGLFSEPGAGGRSAPGDDFPEGSYGDAE